MSCEIELKYQLSPALAERLWTDPFLADRLLAAPRKITMESRYYDTTDAALSAARISLRLRRENGVSCVTLKTPKASHAALSERGEWEVAAPSIETALPALYALGAPRLPDGPLTVHATVSFVRTTAPILVSDTCTAMLCVDVGTFGTVPFCELELELTKGETTVLCAFGETLASRFSLVPELRSKHARARQL